MELYEKILDICNNQKSWKMVVHKCGGMKFQSFVYDCMNRAFVPSKHCRKRKLPTFIAWRLNNGTYKCAWFNLIYHELVGTRFTHDPESGYEGRVVNDYYVIDPEDFNIDQGWELLKGLDHYYSVHDKFTDIFSDENYIFLSYRDKYDEKRYRKVIEGIEWYFYILKDDYDKMMEVLVKKGFDVYIRKTEPEGTKWIKIYVLNKNAKDWNYSNIKAKDHSYMIKKELKGIVQTYEADLDPSQRYAIDNEVKIETDLKVLYYDIETDDSTKQIDMEKNPILSIGGVDHNGEEFWKCSKNEKSIIEWFIDLCRHYDVIVGWNSYNFDAEYIYERSKLYHIHWKPSFRFARLGHVDLMRRIIGTLGKFLEIRSYKLDDIGFQFVGKRKIKYEGRIIDLFNNDRKKLKEYNLWDCHLVKMIDEKMGITNLMVAMCEWTGSFPTMFRPTRAMSGISVSALLDTYILRNAKGTDIHYPTVTWDDDDTTKFEGGLVMDAVKGIYKDVYVLDFKSLYPTVIWTWKISPENVRFDNETDEKLIKSAQPGVWFYKERGSIFPHLVDSLMAARKVYKNMMFESEVGSKEYDKYNVMQEVAKELTNSLYGQLGQRGNRYFDHNVAGSVTGAGRHLLRTTKAICEEMGIKVIYGDTDSVFITELGDINPKELVGILNGRLEQHIQDTFNIKESIIELEYEKKMSRFIQVGGKNYACLLVEKDGKKIDKDDIKGLACVKRSTINRAKKEQELVIDMLLRHDHDQQFYIDHVVKMRRDWFTCIADVDEITVKTKVSKWPKEYKNTSPHVRVAEKLINAKKAFYPQMQIAYIVVDKEKKEEVHVDDYAGEYDKMAYWEKIYKPVMAVLEVCFKEYVWAYHLKNVMPKPKKPKCDLCGYVKCRCENEKENVVAEFEEITEEPVKRKGRFIIKQTKFNKLF